MYLADPAQIRVTLGFDDMANINAAIASALDTAETQLATMLMTGFDRQSVVDTFFVEQTEMIGNSNQPRTELLLTRGFVVGSPTVAVTYAAAQSASAFQIVQDAYSGGSSTSSNFVWRNESGYGVDLTSTFVGAQVAVTYVSGFEADTTNGDDPPISYVIDQVPDWVQKAATLLALTLVADNASVVEAGIVINTKLAMQQLHTLIGKKVRYRPLACDPILSTVD